MTTSDTAQDARVIDCRTNGHVPAHLGSIEVYEQVEARDGVRELSDAAAVTVASWWACPGTDGAALAQLCTTGRVELSAFLRDVRIARAMATPQRDLRALDALATWGLNHPSITGPSHVDYPHLPGYLIDCPACESRCHCTDGGCVYHAPDNPHHADS